MIVYVNENWYALTEKEWIEKIGLKSFNDKVENKDLKLMDIPEHDIYELDNEIDNKFGDCDY